MAQRISRAKPHLLPLWIRDLVPPVPGKHRRSVHLERARHRPGLPAGIDVRGQGPLLTGEFNRRRTQHMQTSVEVHDLVVSRGGREMLHGLAFSLVAGQITGLLGPSGSGKTTLLRALVGVQSGVSGTVRVLGRPAGSADLRRRVGYVTQAPAVYTDLSVQENLAYFAAVLGVGAARVDIVLGQVGLTGRRSQLTQTLSGGSGPGSR